MRLVRDWSEDARRSLDRTRPSRTGRRVFCDHNSARRPGKMLISAAQRLTMARRLGPFSRPPPSASRRTLLAHSHSLQHDGPLSWASSVNRRAADQAWTKGLS